MGRIGGRQYVNLASGCSTGNTIHELLHALGMFHEHTRCDRDTYVIINTANIQSGYGSNFTKQCTNASDYSTYAEGSIMHYGATAFTVNGLPTIVSRRGLDSQMGQRSGMNSTDNSTINTLYYGLRLTESKDASGRGTHGPPPALSLYDYDRARAASAGAPSPGLSPTNCMGERRIRLRRRQIRMPDGLAG